MRTFNTSGPIDLSQHFGVPRTELVKQYVRHMIGDTETGGDYLTLWAPRQTGKTSLMYLIEQEVARHHSDQFAVCIISFEQYATIEEHPHDQHFDTFSEAFSTQLQERIPGNPKITNWDEFMEVFTKESRIWDRRLLLLIDEVDAVPEPVLNIVLKHFREMFHYRDHHWVHGLALMGLKSHYGMTIERGSPYNIQRSIHIPNLSIEEVRDMYQQYQDEHGQIIAPDVVEKVYEVTNGQPGLVSLFGALLTNPDNTTPDHAVTLSNWNSIYEQASQIYMNSDTINHIAKTHTDYYPFLIRLFTQSFVDFNMYGESCYFMYTNGIIDCEEQHYDSGHINFTSRFSSSFLQHCLYKALTLEWLSPAISNANIPISGSLDDVFAGSYLDIAALLAHYQRYLDQGDEQGMNLRKSRTISESHTDFLQTIEHFHLYAWLLQATDGMCTIHPAFSKNYGKVDLVLTCREQCGLIQINTHDHWFHADEHRLQLAHYAQELGLDRATIVLFYETESEGMTELSGVEVVEGVETTITMIHWAGM